MAKTSMINRDVKRAKLAKKFAAKREALKKTISSDKASYEEKMEAAVKLQKLPRDSSSATAASCRAVRAACTASSAWAATSCAKRPCAATFPACARLPGN
jgi:hypothetical protein